METPLYSLSDDVLQSILLSAKSLNDLGAVVLTCKRVYRAFLARRDLITASVFIAEVTNPRVRFFNGHVSPRPSHSHCPLKTSQETRELADAIISRCRATPQDTALLHKAIWQHLMSRNGKLYFSLPWGEKLMARQRFAGRLEDEIAVAEEIWNYMNFNAGPRKSGSASSRFLKSPVDTVAHRNFARRICDLYYDRAEQEKAATVLFTALSQSSEPHNSEFIADYLKALRNIGHSDDGIEYLLLHYQSALSLARHPASTSSMMGATFRTHNCRNHTPEAVTWARLLVHEYNIANNPAAALIIQKSIFTHLITSPTLHRRPANLVQLVAWTRQLVASLKRQNLHFEAIKCKHQVFREILPSHHITDLRNGMASITLVTGWAHELASDYRALNKANEAVEVEKAVWESMRSQVHRNPMARELIFHAKNATWTYIEGLRGTGKTEEIKQVEKRSIRLLKFGGWDNDGWEVIDACFTNSATSDYVNRFGVASSI